MAKAAVWKGIKCGCFCLGPAPFLVGLLPWRRNASLAGGFAARLVLCGCFGWLWLDLPLFWYWPTVLSTVFLTAYVSIRTVPQSIYGQTRGKKKEAVFRLSAWQDFGLRNGPNSSFDSSRMWKFGERMYSVLNHLEPTWTSLNLSWKIACACEQVRNDFKFVGTDLWTIEPIGTYRNQVGTNLEPNGTSLCMEELGDGFSFVFVFLVFLDVVWPMS